MAAIEVHQSLDDAHAAQEAGSAVTQLLTSCRAQQILLLCSGGSSLGVLSFVSYTVFDRRVTLTMLDERVSRDPVANNYLQMAATPFFRQIQTQGVRIIKTVPEDGNPELLADALDQVAKDWVRENPSGVKVTVMGIGPGGQTAGIMPFPDNREKFRSMFEETDRFYIGYDAGVSNPYPLRVTATLPFIRTLDSVIVYACGESKRQPIVRVLSADGDLASTPARILREIKHVHLFTDLALTV